MSYKLQKPYTYKQEIDFIVENNHNKSLKIEKTDNAIYALEADEIMQNGKPVKNPDYEKELAQAKQQTFEKEFFLTSLGYIRRKVSMASGDTKDFLSDLLPAISAGVQMGQQIPIITYSIPDFTKDFSIEYMESLQEIKFAAAEFVQECFLQLSKDFAPVPLVINEGE